MGRRLNAQSIIVSAAIGLTAIQAQAQTGGAEPPPPATPTPQEEITVTAQRLNAARDNIEPNIGASAYTMDQPAIQNMPQGEDAPLNQVLLQAPGVNQDNLANGALHIRNEHLDVQYRVNGVIIPEGASFFGQGLSPRFVQSMTLIDGTLPAEYGLRTAGIVDITTKSGVFQNGGSAELYGGSYWTMQPSAEYGGNIGGWNYYVSGDFLHSDHGINSPVKNYDAVHDETNQEHGFGYAEKIVNPNTKVSAMVGSFLGRFQIPNNPGQTVLDSVAGSTAFDSNALNETQREGANFGILSYLYSEENWSAQVSAFSKYSTLDYSPDVFGDLAFNGIAQYALRQDVNSGIQADASYNLSPEHTLRGGIYMSGERASSDTNSWVECNAAPCPPQAPNGVSDTPFTMVDNSAKTGWTYSAYAQDEWKVLPTVTVNYGGRFDVINTSAMANQLSPRLNTVWTPLTGTTVHAGYANYFTPPPFELISGATPTLFASTTANNTGVLTNDPVKPERAQVFDVGITQDVQQVPGLKIGVDTYYKYARNLIDESQFGAPVILTVFNYHVGYTKGVELSTTYDNGPFHYYGNLAIGEEKAEQINSAQYNFNAAILAYSASHLVNTDHSQKMTASAGMSYLWDGTTFSVDLLAGTGVRTTEPNVTDGTFNNGTVPSYEQVNFGVSHRFEQAPGGPIEIRADLINAFDETYLLREQSGIGVFAPQYGPRRTVFMGVRKFFN
ncbi:MAG TPA: TonB-dependent receptor [Stellaceae bacterium]|nr:TonB-dependent receptor [Stellaceae bacterium]